MRSIRFSSTTDTAWKIFQHFLSLIMSFLFMEKNQLVQEELAYDQRSLTIDADNVEDRFNDDQRNAYESILNAVTNKEGKLFFVYGSGGIGKTFVWITLLSHL